MDELAYKSSNTRKANQFSWKIIHNTIYTEDYTQYNLYRRLYTIQFIQKIIHNTIYTEDYTQYNLYRRLYTTIYTEDYTQYNLYRRLYTIQFIQKIIHNTVYNRSKIEKKIGSMNGLCHFFYILELKLGNIYFTTVQSYNKIISVLKNYMVLR